MNKISKLMKGLLIATPLIYLTQCDSIYSKTDLERLRLADLRMLEINSLTQDSIEISKAIDLLESQKNDSCKITPIAIVSKFTYDNIKIHSGEDIIGTDVDTIYVKLVYNDEISGWIKYIKK